MGVLRSAAHRRVEFRLPVWLRGVFIIAVHHTFVLGLGARHGGIVKLSVVRCVTVFAPALLTYLQNRVEACNMDHDHRGQKRTFYSSLCRFVLLFSER